MFCHNSPLVSVIVTAKNEAGTIQECITSILGQDYPNFELIFVDGHSEDGTFKIAANLKSKVQYFPNCKRYIFLTVDANSPAIGRNIGLTESKGEVIAFTDGDCIAEKKWLINLITVLPPQGGIAGGSNIIRHFNNSKITGTIDTILYSRIGNGGSAQFLKINSISEVEAVATCNLAISKKLIDAAGRFNTKLRSNEDLDLCIRIRKMGYKIIYCPTAIVNHYIGIDSYCSFIKFIYKYGFQKGKSLTVKRALLRYPATLLGFFLSFLFFIALAMFTPFNEVCFYLLILLITISCIIIEILFVTISIREKSSDIALFGLIILLSIYIIYSSGVIVGYVKTRIKIL